jgi:hypothetical protein
MTPERAKEISYEIDQEWTMNPVHKFSPYTACERNEIMQLWATMPGYTCFHDAVRRICLSEKHTSISDRA